MTLGFNGSLRLLLVSLWVFRAAAVLSDLQRTRVLTKHLHAKYSEAARDFFEADVPDLRKLQSWLYELADPELLAVYAESQARGVSVTTVLKR